MTVALPLLRLSRAVSTPIVILYVLLQTLPIVAAINAEFDYLGSQVSNLVDEFVTAEIPIAWRSLMCNISPGKCAPGAVNGVVIASPDTVNPPYFYTWTRDSALVLKYVIEVLDSNYDPNVQRTIQDYVLVQARLQSLRNPSGNLDDGSGLGEAKFNVDLSPYLGPWGRPQRDGPALRAVTLIKYGNWLIQNGYNTTARDLLWPIIANDLAYVAQYWNNTGFELWEEVSGSSVFTTASQHREALREGTVFSTTIGLDCDYCNAVAQEVLCFLQKFWSENDLHILANVNTPVDRAGLDASSILTTIHNFEPSLYCEPSTYQPCSDKALANHKAVVDSFRSLYPINAGIPAGKAIAIGRYAEDVYFDGNPWYLTTLAAAEQLYDSLIVWETQGLLPVTEISLPFFNDLVPEVKAGDYTKSSREYRAIYSAVSLYADGFMDIVRQYAQSNGSLSEQFGKEDGHPLSARDLTWSYAAFLTAAARRAKVVPHSWINHFESDGPWLCSPTSVVGQYTTPTQTRFPTSQTPPAWTGTGTSSTACPSPSDIAVGFVARVETRWGQAIKIVGSNVALGEWDISKAVPLDASEYSSNSPVWKATDLNLQRGEVVEYKYIKIEADGAVTWELDPNHILTVNPLPCETRTSQVDWWQGNGLAK